MKVIPALIFTTFLPCTPVAQTHPQGPRPFNESLNRDLLVGDWTLVGTAKDSPAGPETKVLWKLHGRRILGGHFVQVDQTWKGNGPEEHSLEIVAYDPVKRTHTSFGYSDDGSTWAATATYHEGTLTETGTTTSARGKVSRWRGVHVYGSDGRTVSGTEEGEENGITWTHFTVKGTKVSFD